jgi:PAS domain S-box-containing protein
MKSLRIRNKLVLAISLFISLLLAVIATGTYTYFKHTTRELIFAQQFEMISSTARGLDNNIETAHKALISVAHAIPPDMVSSTESSQQWLNSRAAIRNFFNHSLVVLNNAGVVVASVPATPQMYGTSLADRDYFTATISGGKPYISAPFVARANNRPIVMMTAPLRGADGTITGILCGAMDLMSTGGVFTSLRDIRVGSNGYIYLFTTDRTMIMHPDTSRIMKQDVTPGANKMFDRAVAGFEGSGETINSKGKHFLSSFERLHTTGWILAANYPADEAYQPIIRFRNYYLFGMMGVLLSAIILALTLGAGITRPLTAFTGQIHQLTQPDSDKRVRLDSSRSDELGDLAHSFNSMLDDMQHNEQELHKRENQIRQLLQTTDQGIYGIDLTGRCTFINTSGLRIFGCPLEDIIDKDTHSLIHHSYANGLPYPGEDCPIYRANSSGTSCRVDNEVLWRLDGTPFSAEYSSYPIFENGTVSGAVVTFSDITGRKQAEEALRKLNRAVEQSPVTIVITDIEGIIEFVNPKFTELTGYTAEESIGQNSRILQSGQTAPEVYESLWSTITSGKTWEGDFHNKSKDGRLFWEHATISALRDNSGAITHFLAVKENITEKKYILEQLIAAKEQAEAANVAKSEFLATMSHEIRTPMNGVIGMTGLLLESTLTDEQREYAEIVRKSGEDLLNLINDILDFSKIEAGRLDMEMLDFDLRVTLEDTAEMLALRAFDAGLELICHIDPAVPSCLKGDPGRLRQIIINLVGNALKFTCTGEVVISAGLQSDQDGYATILFEIHDTGIGIPKSRLAAIFEPFTQADGSTTRKYGGTGLGLAICKKMAELMGGQIGVTSVEESGSTFWFTCRFEKQVRHVSEILNTSEMYVKPDLTDVRVLIVDDNATNRKLMAVLLKEWGCRYECAVDGEDGLVMLLAAARSHDPFRIALLDQEMPGMDGVELGRQIKADPLLHATVLVMVTSLARRGDVAVLEKIGFAAYLPKPVRQAQLYDCLGLALARDVGTQYDQSLPTHPGIITRHTIAESGRQVMRILLAEDNAINQKVAQHMLKTLGYKADVVADGREAVRALELINYDLVLMDCQMPEVDGFEATTQIRNPASKVCNHAVPIIALTANAMVGDREKCLEAGMDDYLSKPVKKDELAEMIEKWFMRGTQARFPASS